MSYSISMTKAARRDLEEIYARIAESDSPEQADDLLDQLSKTAENVATMPHRGARLSELPPGIAADYRQVFFKPYRVVYEVLPDEVAIHLIVDGRCNLRTALQRRLAGA
jgi:toxin ParE1/3/4